MRFASRGLVVCLSLLTAAACGIDEAPSGRRRTPPGPGATVRFDLAQKPLPELPFPNDVAAWPDPTSRTGLRVNASLIAPTSMERRARESFASLEGWGTFAPITVSFSPVDPGEPAIDVANVKARHVGDDYDFANDAVYVVDLATGVPVPLDLGAGNFPLVVREPGDYWRNDPRATEPTILFETADETKHGTIGAYSPAADTDFDGVLDRPNLDDPYACEGLAPGKDRDSCVADHLLGFYERETDTLVLRPLIPLRERAEYAVVLTDRLVDGKGRPVKSPFDFVYHPQQDASIGRLEARLRETEHAAYYGDIAGTGLDHVAFAWTFTTAPQTEDLVLLRDGLYGSGPFAYLGDQFPPDAKALPVVGKLTADEIAQGLEPPADWQSDPKCAPRVSNLHVLRVDQDFKENLASLAALGFGAGGPDVDAIVASFDSIDHFVFGTYRTPFLLAGGPKSTDTNATFHLDFKTGVGDVGADEVVFFLAVPKAQNGHAEPFPVDVFGHGYGGSNIQAIAYAGNLARDGIATIAINAWTHGLVLPNPHFRDLADTIMDELCVGPFGDGLFASRARDLNGDGVDDPGGDFLTGYVFHTRDNVRQAALDLVQLVRVLRAFDGRIGSQDYDGDGKNDALGDFDVDGIPDVGGPNVTYGTWGQSLGGILSSIHGGLDANVQAAAPASPGGGLTDVIVRSNEHEVVAASVLRTIGPLVVGVPAGSLGKGTKTACTKDQTSLRFIVPDVNATGEIELGCTDALGKGAATVVVTDIDDQEIRCARAGEDGSFRIGIPTSLGDRAMIEIWDGADRIDSYATCNVLDGSKLLARIDTWGKGTEKQGAVDAVTGSSCDAPDGCRKFQGSYYRAGDVLRFPADGLGLRKASPDLRRFLTLTQMALDAADPISFAPRYALSPPIDSTGVVAPARGLLTIGTVGDQTVPINTGNALARAAGALPFFRPDQAAKYPEYASYATPAALWEALGKETPNQFLIEHHVFEGLARLQRHPGSNCRPNEKADVACHKTGCASGVACGSGQSCVNDTCETVVDATACAEALYDSDDVDEGRAPWGEENAPVPLRLGRIAAPATPSTLDAIWAPRLLGVPHGSDAGAWDASAPVVALLDAYIVPWGQHAFYNPAACEEWDNATYLADLVGRFLQTGGRDLYYLSHPATHECLATHACEF